MNDWKRVAGGDLFEDFLWSIATDSTQRNRRFVARNFLLDEGVNGARRQSYAEAEVTQRHAGFEDWSALHFHPYLREWVFLDKRTVNFSTLLDTDDVAACPETFRVGGAFSRFGMADDKLELIRVEQAQAIAQRAGVPMDALLDLAGKQEAGTVTPAETGMLNDVLGEWEKNSWVKPVWAAFYEDVADLFDPNPADWADQLRDQLGLYHLDPPGRAVAKIPVMVFKYPVSALPRIRGRHDIKPLSVPTVLDGELSEAFCPAPVGQACGFVVNLAGDYPVRREVLHPPIGYKPEYLYKVGAVRRSVPADLSAARGYHLTWICSEKGPSDYAWATDGDLL